MAHNNGDSASPAWDAPPPPRESIDDQAALVSDGFSMPDLEEARDAPPPYGGDLHDQLQFSQSGFEAGANVTGMARLDHKSQILGLVIRE